MGVAWYEAVRGKTRRRRRFVVTELMEDRVARAQRWLVLQSSILDLRSRTQHPGSRSRIVLAYGACGAHRRSATKHNRACI